MIRQNEKISKTELELQIKRDISNAWDAFQNSLYILKVESQSVSTSISNLERTLELYNRGQATSVEFRQAQLNLLNTEIGLNNAKYASKILELELKYLSGRILSEEL